MNKAKILALLQKKEARKAALVQKAGTCEDIAELRGINLEMDALNTEIQELRGILDSMPDDPGQNNPDDPDGRTAAVTGEIPGIVTAGRQMQSPVTTRSVTNSPEDRTENPTATPEYRQAFMTYAQTGEMSQELRANAVTTSGDVAAMIPVTIVNEVIKKLEAYGQVYNRVRKLSIKGGVKVPISAVKPVATWIGESAVSDRQKLDTSTGVTFTYFGLECRIATSLLADTVSLTGFESLVVNLMVEAMIKAMEIAVVSGAGTNGPLGVTKDTRVPTGNVVTMAAADMGKWDAWKKKVFAKMPIRYKAGAVFITSSQTFEGYIDGMVDDNGQPIGRVNYGITDGPQGRFAGKEVIEVEDDVIAAYDDAAAGDVIAILMDLKNYAVNSNMQMTLYRYFDHETNQWVDKAILIADGKLLDPHGVIIIKKGA